MITSEYYLNVSDLMKKLQPELKALQGEGETLPIITVECEV